VQCRTNREHVSPITQRRQLTSRCVHCISLRVSSERTHALIFLRQDLSEAPYLDTRRIQSGSLTRPSSYMFYRREEHQNKARTLLRQRRRDEGALPCQSLLYTFIIPISHHLSCRCVKEPTCALPCRPDQSRTVLTPTQRQKVLTRRPCIILL
jgi:hypothetical protein